MPSFPTDCWPIADLRVHEAPQWASEVASRMAAGDRVVSLFGRADGPSVLLTAVLQEPTGQLTVARGRASPEHGYHALTEVLPAMHCFERELHEQTGLPIAGHPWLKPIRFQGAAPHAARAYPFYRITGKEVHEVQVGPVHAGVIEPGAFRFMCLGETVHHLEIHLGYQHRGVEALLRKGDPRKHAPLAETIAGDSSVAHAWAYCAAVEALAGVDVDPPVELARAFGLELERIAMHLAGLAGLAADVGFLQGAATYGRLRTTAINTSMLLCGSRFGHGWLRPGANRVSADDNVAQLVRSNLALLIRDLAIINARFIASVTVRHRFSGTGIVTSQQARDLGLVGMAARASGVPIDQRSARLGAYRQHPIDLCVEQAGDCWARAILRIHEIDRSLVWLTSTAKELATLARTQRPIAGLRPGQLVVATCEGWRGEIMHAAETDADGRFVHYKVQDPSLRNWFGLALAVRENEISDFPICNKSFDLSYCGHDL